MKYEITSNALIFSIDRDTAIKLANVSPTQTIRYVVEDTRPKTYEQIKLFWKMLDELLKHLFPKDYHALTKSDREKIKQAMYDEYAEEKNIRVRLSRTNVTNARMFIDWCIRKYAYEYGFIPQQIDTQENFNSAYVYATLINKKCAVCGNSGEINTKRDKSICLCSKHNELSNKELQDYHLERIYVNDELKKLLEECNELY